MSRNARSQGQWQRPQRQCCCPQGKSSSSKILKNQLTSSCPRTLSPWKYIVNDAAFCRHYDKYDYDARKEPTNFGNDSDRTRNLLIFTYCLRKSIVLQLPQHQCNASSAQVDYSCGHIVITWATSHYVKWWSHAHTVVWECCKDDRQSQWGMAKFDPQRLSRRETPEQIVTKFETRDYVANIYYQEKLGVNPPRGFCPHIREIHTQNLRMFTSFFSFLPSPHRRARLTDFRA